MGRAIPRHVVLYGEPLDHHPLTHSRWVGVVGLLASIMKVGNLYDPIVIAAIMAKEPSKICATCKGTGQTREAATVIKQVSPKVWVTTSLGSGCLVCLGRGIIGKRRVWPGLGVLK